jgi:hypothetical protein
MADCQEQNVQSPILYTDCGRLSDEGVFTEQTVGRLAQQ